MYDHTKTELYLPNGCYLEAPIRLNNNIPGEAKIYFGELAVLANKHSVIKYTDEQLSKMKEVPIRTIQSWHNILRKYGFLTSNTFNVLLPLEEGETKRKWKKFRDMYVCQRPDSKKDTDTAENCGTNDTAENCGISEEEKKKITTEEASPVVDDSEKDIKLRKKESLENLKVSKDGKKVRALTDGQVMSLMGRPLESILKACERFELEKSVDTPVRWLSKCMSQKWWLNDDSGDVEEHTLFESFKNCLVKMRRDYKEKLEFTVEDEYIHLNINGGGIDLSKSNFSDKNFIVDVLKVLNNTFVSKRKIVHVKLKGENKMEIMR